LPADADGPALKGVMWYLCSEPPGEIDLGDIALPGVKDCPISGHKLPLVVVSRGAGGNFVGHHDIAETLADAGFVVAAINHPGHTTSDMSRSGDLSVFIERPTDIKRLIDFMLGASAAAPNIDLERIGFFGFSAGGDTGLILIGANPGLLPYANDRRRPLCASKSSEDSCGCSRSRMTRGSRPPSSPTRAAFGLPRTALRPSRYRSSCGHRNVRPNCAECRCPRLQALPPWTETCRLSTSIMWCRIPDMSPSYSFARPH
jgi:predicted dienelactone hydrolase